MLAKLGELHQSLCPRPARNPGAAWGSTCLEGPCEQGPNVVLETTVLHWERPEVKLVQFESCESTLAKDGTPQETFCG
jgi:hypothetical protein